MTLEERNQLILENSRLVTSVVKKMYRSPYAYYDKEDMYQQGYIGLIKAVERFDPSKGFAFSTYAVPMIQGEVMRFIRENAQTLRYARSDIDALHRMNRAGKEIDDLTPEDIENLELTEKNLAAIRSMTIINLDTPISEDSSNTLEYFLADKSQPELSENIVFELIENIKNIVISKMDLEKQDMIDEWYYSMIVGMEPNQMYLARKYGCSQAQVSRIIRQFKDRFAIKLMESGFDVPYFIPEQID